MKLTAVEVKNAKPKDRPYRMFDGGGMYLEILPAGGRYWRMKYRFGGKEKRLAFGVYPDVSLAQARERRDAARKILAQDMDPADIRNAQKAEALARGETFEIVAREWFEKFKPRWSEGHAGQIMRRFELNTFPWIGAKPIKEILAPELLAMARRIESRGALEMAHRVLQACGQVFRYAVATGRAERDPTGDLRGALPPTNEKHHASLTAPKEVAQLLRAIDGYTGGIVTRCALQLAALTFVRPGELRHAEWTEINFDTAEWRIPAHKMKMKAQHIVPLSRQALVALHEIHPLTSSARYVFPSERTGQRPMSENTVNAALRRLGYSKEQMTGHGFRSIASTMLNEMGWNRDAIERQLAHAERNNVRAAYNFAEFLPLRREMMQAWADHLDSLRTGAKVIPIGRVAGQG
jgi:integrase